MKRQTDRGQREVEERISAEIRQQEVKKNENL